MTLSLERDTRKFAKYDFRCPEDFALEGFGLTQRALVSNAGFTKEFYT